MLFFGIRPKSDFNSVPAIGDKCFCVLLPIAGTGWDRVSVEFQKSSIRAEQSNLESVLFAIKGLFQLKWFIAPQDPNFYVIQPFLKKRR